MKSNLNVTPCDSLQQSIIKVYAFSYSEPETIKFSSTEIATICTPRKHVIKNRVEIVYNKVFDILGENWISLTSLKWVVRLSLCQKLLIGQQGISQKLVYLHVKATFEKETLTFAKNLSTLRKFMQKYNIWFILLRH